MHKPLGIPMKYKNAPEFNHSFHRKARQLQPKIAGHRDMEPPFGHAQPCRTRLQNQLRVKGAHSRLGVWVVKDMVGNGAEHRTAAGKAELKKEVY